MTNHGAVNTGAELSSAQAHSAAFKKEMGLGDLTLAQILIVLSTFGVGTAAKAGASHLVLWLLAILLFYLPAACVVIFLSRRLPLEGGLYQWAKVGFNESVGFMVAWNYWLFGILFVSSIGLSVATSLSYAIGSRGGWIAGSKWSITLASFIVIGALTIIAIRGLSIGKWVHNVGSLVQLLAFALLLILPVLSLTHGMRPAGSPLTLEMPALTLLNLIIFVKVAVFGLGGLEYVAVLAGECRDPGRSIGRSVVVAVPLIAILNILGTSAVLTFVSPPEVDLINPLAQILRIGFHPLGLAATIVPIVILALMAREVAQFSLMFTGNTRLPMVAGWDRLLPRWFIRLHATHKTPVNSILFVGAMTFGVALVDLIGVREQEAYQLLISASGIIVAGTNLVLFAIPLFGSSRRGLHPPIWLRVVAASGFLMVLLFMVLSIFPIIEVEDWLTYSMKISAVVIAAQLTGASILLLARRRQREQHDLQVILTS